MDSERGDFSPAGESRRRVRLGGKRPRSIGNPRRRVPVPKKEEKEEPVPGWKRGGGGTMSRRKGGARGRTQDGCIHREKTVDVTME